MLARRRGPFHLVLDQEEGLFQGDEPGYLLVHRTRHESLIRGERRRGEGDGTGRGEMEGTYDGLVCTLTMETEHAIDMLIAHI